VRACEKPPGAPHPQSGSRRCTAGLTHPLPTGDASETNLAMHCRKMSNDRRLLSRPGTSFGRTILSAGHPEEEIRGDLFEGGRVTPPPVTSSLAWRARWPPYFVNSWWVRITLVPAL
jgi:hypothetical protein